MKYCNRISVKLLRQNNRTGFTLVELVVVIVVFIIIGTAAIVNWLGFIQYQDMRRAAQNFHKELIAIKVSALESGDKYRITYVNGGNSYNVLRNGSTVRTTEFPSNVIIKTLVPDGNMTGDCSAKGWAGSINVNPENLFSPFDSGSVIITKSGAENKRTFCIANDGKEVNPRIFFRSNAGGTWKKI